MIIDLSRKSKLMTRADYSRPRKFASLAPRFPEPRGSGTFLSICGSSVTETENLGRPFLLGRLPRRSLRVGGSH
jgi:hypothetical protein